LFKIKLQKNKSAAKKPTIPAKKKKDKEPIEKVDHIAVQVDCPYDKHPNQVYHGSFRKLALTDIIDYDEDM
jgi:hypothetical protein